MQTSDETYDELKHRVDSTLREFIVKRRRLPFLDDIRKNTCGVTYADLCKVYGTTATDKRHRILTTPFHDVLVAATGVPYISECIGAYLDGRGLVHFKANDVGSEIGAYTTRHYGKELGVIASRGTLVHGYRITRRSPGGNGAGVRYTAELVDDDATVDVCDVLDRVCALNLSGKVASFEGLVREFLKNAGDSKTFVASDVAGNRTDKSKLTRLGWYLARRDGDVIDGYMLQCTKVINYNVYTATKIQPWHEAATYLEPGEVVQT